MTKGNIPGIRLSIPRYQEITDSYDFRMGLWRIESLCTHLIEKDPDNYKAKEWFPTRTASPPRVPVKIANICGECTVRLECLSYAITITPEDGIWAGHTAKVIKRMARKIRSKQ